MALIEVKNLEKIYTEDGNQTPGLCGVDLKIEEGEFVAIIGPSGSGKSTLLQILGCLDKSTSGTYLFEGKEISKYDNDELAKVRNSKMGFVFQAFNLLPKMTVLENVKLPLVYAGVPDGERDQRGRKMVDAVGLNDRIDFNVTKLSGGQKQRVAIARALVNHPKVVFADEPTGSLDSKSGEVIMGYLEKLNQEGNTIVMVTHETYVAECAQRILHIKDGLIDRDEKVKNRRIISQDGFFK